MPLLMNVKGFNGIRIHSGNTISDTEGCLVFGYIIDKNRGIIGDSKRCCDDFKQLLLLEENQSCIVEILNEVKNDV